jgi:hypothetical protein
MGKEDTTNKVSFNFNITASGMWQSSGVPVSSIGPSETFINTVEQHLSGLIGSMSHADIRKIRIIGFFFEHSLHWQFEVEKEF